MKLMSKVAILCLTALPPAGAQPADPPRAEPGARTPAAALAARPRGDAQDTAAFDLHADARRGHTLAMGGAGVPNACFTCHGLAGQGARLSAVPRLAGQHAFYLYKQLQDYASGARPNAVMGPIAAALSEADMRDVAAYYAGRTSGGFGAVSDGADPLRLQHGGSLSAVGDPARGIEACSNCHGPGGTGVAPMFPVLAGQHAAYLEAQLLEWKRGRRGNDALGVMAYIARNMSAEDIRAAALYFESVRPGNPEAQRDAGE